MFVFKRKITVEHFFLCPVEEMDEELVEETVDQDPPDYRPKCPWTGSHKVIPGNAERAGN